MSEEKRPHSPDPQDSGYVPASPVKRTMAWIGVVYAVGILFLTTYYFFTGHMLGNLGPLLALPGLLGLGVVALVSHHSTGRPSRGAAILMACACWALVLLTLPVAITGLLSNFRG